MSKVTEHENFGVNVDRLEILPMTEKRKLDLSNGEIDMEGMPEKTDEDLLDFPQRGLYSEEIFGVSMDSARGQLERYQDSFPERMRNFGHIDLHFPYVHPDLYGNNGSAIATLLGVASPKMLTKIIEWESLLVRVELGSETHEYLTQIKGNGMDNYASEMDIVSHFERKVNSVVREAPDALGNIKKTRFKTHQYWHVPLKAVRKRDIKGFEQYKSLSYWSTREDVDIFMGGFAVIHLLQQINIEDEVSFTWAALKAREQMMDKEVINTESRMDASKTAIRKLSERYQMLINYKKNNITWDALVSNILLVMPAGLRDVTIRRDEKGGVVLMKSEINDKYVDIITSNKSLKGYTNNTHQITNILNKEGNDKWYKSVTYRQSVIDNAKEIQRAINDISLVKITDKVGKKEGRFRQSILSKRIDYTARAVITPNPSLKLNEIGIPLYILRKFMKDILKEISSKNTTIPQEGVMKFLDNYDEVMRQIVVLEESSKIDELDVEFVEFTEVQANNIKIIRKIEELLSEMRVIAIRFPTLHKYNTMGFRMKIVYDNTIHLHPLVCPPYNADFDGDQMSVYLIQTPEGVEEVDKIMLPSKNLLSTSGSQLIKPTQDAVLGSHFMTLKSEELDNTKKSGKIPTFHSYEEMFRAYQSGRIGLNDSVEVYTPHYTESTYEELYYDFRNLESVMEGREAYTGATFSEILENNSTRLLDEVPEFTEDFKRTKPGKYITSVVGRFIFNTILPQDLGFVNREEDPYGLEVDELIEQKTRKDPSTRGLTSGLIGDALKKIVQTKHEDEAIYVLDKVKEVGYNYATEVGISMSLQDIHSHPDKQDIIDKAQEETDRTKELEEKGELTREEAYEKNILTWTKANDKLTDVTLGALPDSNTIKMMASSGSRGNETQLAQLMGMRGLMADTAGNTIETPITSSFEDGLSQAEFFTASFGTRKGIYDRSNRTKDTGAATRTAVYGAEHVIISKGDCGDTEGLEMTDLRIPILEVIEEEDGTKTPTYTYKKYTEEDGPDWEEKEKKEIQKSLSKRLVGKFTLEDIYGKDGEVLVEAGMPVMKDYPEINEVYMHKSIKVRSPITCKETLGICTKCYGYNFGSDRFAQLGDAVGTMAAQSIGEPGTQLTMRTFHTGGVAKDGGITQGFDAVRKLLETKSYPEHIQHKLNSIAIATPYEIEEVVKAMQEIFSKEVEKINSRNYKEHGLVHGDGYKEVMELVKESLQLAYQTQGIDLKDVHYEVLARAMGTELEVVSQGDSIHPVGKIINWSDLKTTNDKLMAQGYRPVVAIPTIASLKQVAMGTKSPLTAMTFQDLNKTITQALTVNGVDHLTNPMISVAVSNVLASGEGAKVHLKRKEQVVNDVVTNQEFLENIGIKFDEEELMEVVTEKVEAETKPETVTKPKEEPKAAKEEFTVEELRKLREESEQPKDLSWEIEDAVEEIFEEPKGKEDKTTDLSWETEGNLDDIFDEILEDSEIEGVTLEELQDPIKDEEYEIELPEESNLDNHIDDIEEDVEDNAEDDLGIDLNDLSWEGMGLGLEDEEDEERDEADKERDGLEDIELDFEDLDW